MIPFIVSIKIFTTAQGIGINKVIKEHLKFICNTIHILKINKIIKNCLIREFIKDTELVTILY